MARFRETNQEVNILFELIQVACGSRETLSHFPSPVEWRHVFVMSQEQAITGIVFEGVKKCCEDNQKPPLEIVFEWISICAQITQRNRFLDERCKELICFFQKENVSPTILKGQGIACYYGHLRALRQSGDIDIYVDCGRKKALLIAEKLACLNPKWDYLHLNLAMWSETEIEVHYRVGLLMNPIKNRKLQKWFITHKPLLYSKKYDIITPTHVMNRFYILLHMYSHFLSKGIGLRQIQDYYFVLVQSDHSDFFPDGTTLEDNLKAFGLIRFARGITWILIEKFQIEKKYTFCEPLEKEGKFILKDIMNVGNLGIFNQRWKLGYGKMGYVLNIMRRCGYLISYYPYEVFWLPIGMVNLVIWKTIIKLK